MASRNARVAFGLLAFALLFLVALAVAVPRIENDLTQRVERQLTAAKVNGVGVTFSGRDGTMQGPARQEQAAFAAVTDREGIRTLDYSVSQADVVPGSTTTTAPPITVTTLPTTTTTSSSTTTSTSSSTTSSTTTSTSTSTTSTTEPAAAVDATAGIQGGTITLSGVVASAAQHQVLTAAARQAFLPQGTVVDQVTVQAGPTSPADDQAIAGLGAFITAGAPALLSGHGHLHGRALAVDGQGFNAATTSAVNSAIAASGTQYGLTVTGTVTDGLVDAQSLQPSLDALLGRSGVNFDADSATIDADSEAVLDTAAASILQQPANVEVRGYTDNQGDPAANLLLSQQRADAVVQYLVGKGVPAATLTAVGKGEADPIADNDTAAGRAKNRRIELHVQEA